MNVVMKLATLGLFSLAVVFRWVDNDGLCCIWSKVTTRPPFQCFFGTEFIYLGENSTKGILYIGRSQCGGFNKTEIILLGEGGAFFSGDRFKMI